MTTLSLLKPGQRLSRRPFRRAAGLTASVLFHVAVVLLLSTLPARRPAPEPAKPPSAVLSRVILVAPPRPKPKPPEPQQTVFKAPVARKRPSPAPKLAAAKPPPRPRPERFKALPVAAKIRSGQAVVAAAAPRIETQASGAAPGIPLAVASELRLEDLPLPIQIGGFSSSTVEGALIPQQNLAAAGFTSATSEHDTSTKRHVTSTGSFTEARASRPRSASNPPPRVGGFRLVEASRPAPVPTAVSSAGVEDKPVEILSKPDPAYTDDARQNRIEGDVVLQARFRADGGIDILRVVRGLGHGLDDSAMQAARGIRFRPAERVNQAIDSVATVTIRFRMAY